MFLFSVNLGTPASQSYGNTWSVAATPFGQGTIFYFPRAVDVLFVLSLSTLVEFLTLASAKSKLFWYRG